MDYIHSTADFINSSKKRLIAGSQLTLTVMDLEENNEYFIATLMLGITLTSNLAAGFVIGIAHLLKWNRLSV